MCGSRQVQLLVQLFILSESDSVEDPKGTCARGQPT